MANEKHDADTFGWRNERFTECDKCHCEKPCCTVDFWDGSGDWDYCQACWRKLSESGALDGHWV